MKIYYTYILANKRKGTLYTGVTSDLARRMAEHKEGKIPGFTQRYGIKMLVWYQEFSYIEHALLAEKRLKKAIRRKKIELIEEMNPDWKDLSDFSSPE